MCGTMVAASVAAADEGGSGARVALVVGNGAYEAVPALPNPHRDAMLLAEKLRRLGFVVIEAVDVDLAGMKTALSQFGEAATGADAALFFFAGHGVQAQGRNFLLPISARVQNRQDLYREALLLDLVMTELAAARPRVNIVILDACRDDPLAAIEGEATRSLGGQQGLATVRGPTGTLIAYATAPGEVALDGDGENSPFTSALATWIDEPGLEIGPLMRRVRQDVMETTGDRQVPWVEEAVVGEFYFNPVARKEVVAEEQLRPFDVADSDAIFWRTIETLDKGEQRRAALELYTNVFPTGDFVEEAQFLLAAIDNDVPEAVVQTSLSALAPPGPGMFTELLVWEGADLDASSAGFERYLDTYPSGLFSELAVARLREADDAGANLLANGNIQVAELRLPYGIEQAALPFHEQLSRALALSTKATATVVEVPTSGAVTLGDRALAVHDDIPADQLGGLVYETEQGVTGSLGRAVVDVRYEESGVDRYVGEIHVAFPGLRARDLSLAAGIGPVPFSIALPEFADATFPTGGEVVIEALPHGVRAFTREAEVEPGARLSSANSLELALALPEDAAGEIGDIIFSYAAVDRSTGDEAAIRRTIEALSVRSAVEPETAAFRQVQGVMGVGPQRLPLDLPEDGAEKVLIEAVPFVDLRLAGGGPLEVGAYLSAADLEGLTFAGFRHIEGPVGRLVYSYPAADGDRLVDGVDLSVTVHDCDLLAADPLDPDRVADGTWLFRFRGDGRETYLDSAATILACLQATSAFPELPRFQAQLARAYIGVEDYAAALRWLEPAAAAGYPPAKSGLALLHSRGWGVPQDHERAFGYWQAAALDGHVASQHEVGLAYWEGRGVKQDMEQAAHWIALAADYGFHWAQHNLARLYRDGLGVPQNDAAAVALWQEAVTENNGWAQLELGRMLMAGRGIERDVVEALALFEAAASAEIDWASVELARLYARGEDVPLDIERAEMILDRAIAADSVPARLERARLALTNGQRQTDAQLAIELLAEAGERGSAQAQFELGQLYYQGQVIARDAPRAAAYFGEAAAAGHLGGMTQLAHLTRRGDGATADPAAARALYARAAERRHGWAEVELAGMLVDGEGGPADLASALERYLRLAAQTRDPALSARAEREIKAIPREQLVGFVQASLAARGFDAGPADGLMGPTTRRAIEAFQAEAGLAADGSIGMQLLAALLRD